MDNFILQIQAMLNTKGIKVDYEKLKQEINKDPMMAKLGIDSSASKQQVMDLASEIHKSLDGIFKNAGINDMKVSVKDIENMINGSFKSAQQGQQTRIKEANDLLQKEKSEYQSIHDIQEKISKLNPTKNKNEISVLEQQIQLHKDDLKSVQNKISTYSGIINQETRINDLLDARKKSIEQIDSMNAKQTDSSNQKAIIDEKKFVVANEQAYKTNDKLNNSIEITKTKADSSQKSLSSYTSSLKSSYVKENISKINELNNAFEKVKQTGSKVDYSKAQASLQNFKQTAKEAGAETSSLTQVIKDNIGAFSNWYIIGGAVSSLIGNFKNAIVEIKEIDTLLTEVSKTSDMSSASLKQLGINAFDSASQYGITAQNYLSGYLEMSRAGFENAEEMSKLSVLAQSAGDMPAEIANKYLIATNAAYDLKNNAQALTEVLDGQNQISNQTAIEMTDIAAATTKAGSIASQYGVKVDELSALIATAGSKTRESGEEVGDALKSIFVNLQNADSKKIRTTFESVGISMTKVVDGSKKLKTPIELLKELSGVFNSLEDGSTKKASILTNIGGKYRANTLSAILSGYKDYQKILKMYGDGTGSAEQEAQKSANSLEGRLNKLSNTWNRTVANIVKSDILKTFVSAGTGVVDFVDKIHLLQTALIGLTAFGAFKGGSALITWFKDTTTSAMNFGSVLNTIKTIDKTQDWTNLALSLESLSDAQIKTALNSKNLSSETIAFGNAMKAVNMVDSLSDYDALGRAIKGLSAEQAVALLSTKGLNAESIGLSLSYAGLATKEEATTTATKIMATAEATATTSTLSLKNAFTAMGVAIKSNPIGLIITGLTIAYSVFSGVSADAKQKQEELKTSISENAEKSKSLTDEIATLSLKYNELSKAVETDASVKDDLLTTQTELLTKLGLEGQSIDELIKKYGSLDKAIKVASMSQLQDSEADLKAKYNTSKDELKDYVGSTPSDLFSVNVNNYKKSNSYDKNAVKTIQKLLDAKLVEKGNYVSTNGNIQSYVLSNVDTSSFEGVLNYYKKIKDAIDAINSSGLDTDALDNDVFNTLKSEYDELKVKIDAYNSDATTLNTNLVKQQYLMALQGKEMPTTKDAFESFKQELVNSAVASKEFVGSQDQIMASVENYLATQPEFAKFFGNTSSEAKKSAETTKKSFQDAFNADSFSKSKSKLIELSKAGKLSEDTLSSNSKYQKLLEDTGLSAKEAVDYINKVAKSTITLSDAMSKLSTDQDLMSNLRKEIKDTGSISIDSLQKIISTYSELEPAVNDYLAGKMSEKTLLKKMQSAYQDDVSKYKTAVFDKMSTDKTFYNDMLKGLDSNINALASKYGIDLSNYTSYQASKLGITQKYQDAINDLQNVQALNNVFTSPFGTQWSETNAEGNVEKKYKKKVTDIQKIQNAMNKLASNYKKSITVPKSSSTLSSNKDDKKKKDKTSEDKYLENAQAQIATIKHQLDMGEISEKTYYSKLDKLNDKYFKGKKKYLDQYRQYEEEVYSGEKKLYDDAIKSQFDSLEHKYNMGEISEAKYQKKRIELANKYYKNDKDHLSDYQSIQEEYYKWLVQKDEDALQKRVDNLSSYESTMIDSFNNAISNIKDEASDLPDGSLEQYSKLADGVKVASNEITYLKSEIEKLNGMYHAGAIDEKNYTELLKTLNDELDNANSSVSDIEDSMASAFDANYNEVLDNLSDAYDKTTDAINDQYDAYEKLINAQKDSLEAQKDLDDYNNDVSDKTSEINKIQARISELQKASNSGDRNATKELGELQDELADKQKALNDIQADHKLKLEENALDNSLDNYKTITDKQLEDAKEVYNKRLEDLKSLYAKEEELIKHASNYTETEFTTKMTALNTQIQGIIDGINGGLGTKVGGVSTDTTGSIIDSLKGIFGTGSGSNNTDNSTDAIKKILQNGNGNGAGSSNLNKYVANKYGHQLSYKQMADIATLLGMSGVTTDNIVSDTATKDLILKKLIAGSFSTGGYVDARSSSGSLSSLIKSSGEDGLALVRHGEPILTVEQGKLFKELVGNLQPLNSLVKLSTPNLSNVVTNNTNNSSPVINVNLPASTIIDNNAVNNYRKFIPEIADAVSEKILNANRQYK